ncbi:MAG: tRNA (adenosine(37)-N6)-threonylcarbamoyltransferase complex transferase subunit TsaD [Candidatus Omnitrophica bacterium]|nr:tRNA (adenosine(37)-N6)-threonylcarbamoyltransferase complex transferase subunit TsaD [Candidatus Omnitrophota bacterium]MDE2008812.1 tRNA (adenosine(37)-N6)-threonylcarbamoyltransferase complex transferase subunit TsaD [Candidatus Omnitrophota bacterium]MDE2213625.1 tRNA (adenosine(37)-N6)-threonylcarbamoyltransferase complex transferase subunit TsaD [Candidatus Omnitrophota bacterium]MDE2230474.1 tRNA (adenosine(37)-N6)-threonylcarbamoyltransferase complex transferase subunit TsaD [Candidat
MKTSIPLTILGIETSCDETAAAVVQDGVRVHSNVVATSLKEHEAYGGIIPEIASRRQIEFIDGVVAESLKSARMTFEDIDAIAVTRAPGLIGSLLVGLCFARGLSHALNKPLVEIDHIKAHLYANYVQLSGEKAACPQNRLPAVGLVVSGGHTSLFYIENFRKFKLLGTTRDDAAGEAFDKVARILGLGYPGGPAIDRLAAGVKGAVPCNSREAASSGIKFPPAPMKGGWDFSFSGTKTAVLYYVQRNGLKPDYSAAQVAHAFQESVVAVLAEKSLQACRKFKVNTLLVGGGVAANSALRRLVQARAGVQGVDVFFPPMVLCLDNAAMIAGLAYHWHNNN